PLHPLHQRAGAAGPDLGHRDRGLDAIENCICPGTLYPLGSAFRKSATPRRSELSSRIAFRSL
ncbi:MAG: hypothetical protein WBW33_37755, partial [Bryobacteraceae bacterium]